MRSFIIFNQKSFFKRIFWKWCTGTKMPIWLFGKNVAFLPSWHFCPCACSFGQMSSGWVLWKTSYKLLLKKCLRTCPGLPISLPKRMNWIISSFPQVFLFWIAWMILEGWEVELEWVHSINIQTSEITLCTTVDQTCNF